MSLCTTSALSLNTSRDGDCSTSPGSLCQCSTALSEKKSFLICNLFSAYFPHGYCAISSLWWSWTKALPACLVLSMAVKFLLLFSTIDPIFQQDFYIKSAHQDVCKTPGLNSLTQQRKTITSAPAPCFAFSTESFCCSIPNHSTSQGVVPLLWRRDKGCTHFPEL